MKIAILALMLLQTHISSGIMKNVSLFFFLHNESLVLYSTEEQHEVGQVMAELSFMGKVSLVKKKCA